MTAIIAIDPGASGGIAWSELPHDSSCVKMPEGMTEQADGLRSIAAGLSTKLSIMVYIERVGTYMPGNSATASVKFARHCGHLEAICYMLGLPVVQVAPQTWMKSLGALPSDKGERKRAIKELMARQYPHLSVTLCTADALAILTHARRIEQ